MANKGAATLIYTSADLSTQHVQYQAEIQSKPGLTWGIPSIDQHVLPMRGGNVALIVARPGHAKTATLSYLALTESTRIIERGKQDEEVVVFVTLENAVDDIYAALMAARSNAYTASDYYWGRVDLGVVEQNATQRGVLPLNMIGLSTMRQTEEVLNLDTIFECVEAISTGRDSAGTRVPQRKVTLLLIDYLQLIEVPGAHDKVDTVGRAIVGCKKLGIKYNVPSFLAAQASRDVDSYNVKIPMEKDVQWSSSGEQAADKVFGLWMPWKTEPVHNLRDGQIPTVNVYGRDYPISPRTLFVEMRKQRGEAARRLWCMDIRPELLTLADGERDIDRIELGYAYE